MSLQQIRSELSWASRYLVTVGVAGLVASGVTLASVSQRQASPSPDRASAGGQRVRLASLDMDPVGAAVSVATKVRGAAPLSPTDPESFAGRFNSSFGERSLSFAQRFAATPERDPSTTELPRDSQAPSVTPTRQNARQAMLTPAPSGASGGVGTNKAALPADKHGDSILASLGTRTAIYDISARVVYLPNGETLEAHSGLGEHLDDPRSVGVKSRGATPPNVYALSLRERLFHGVRAVRLTPVEPDKMYGRDGILAHTYLLGPNGDSNGCVSIKNYKKFLEAYLNGDIERLVVVDNLSAPPSSTTAVGWLSEKVKALFRSS
jgi:hypothetical protein